MLAGGELRYRPGDDWEMYVCSLRKERAVDIDALNINCLNE